MTMTESMILERLRRRVERLQKLMAMDAPPVLTNKERVLICRAFREWAALVAGPPGNSPSMN